MEWISVEDRLPVTKKYVLVFYHIPGTARKYYNHIDIGKLTGIISGENYSCTNWTDMYQNKITPTHWQLLPDPPK